MKYKYKPLLRELRSSFKSRSREYFLENNLHGVPYFVDSTRPKWERMSGRYQAVVQSENGQKLFSYMVLLSEKNQLEIHLIHKLLEVMSTTFSHIQGESPNIMTLNNSITWFLLTALSIVAIVAIIATFLYKFQTEPTITGLDIITEHIGIEFPQIFICFDWSHLNHSHIREDETHIYEQLYNWTLGKDIHLTSFNLIYKSKNNFRRIFELMGPDCNYLIKDCMYRGTNISCSQLFTKVLTSVGACCRSSKLEFLKVMDASRNLEFKIENSNFPLSLYFTQPSDSNLIPGERPAIRMYFPVDIEFIVEITYTTSDIRYLLLRQRKCYYNQEGISLNDCEINCLRDKLFAHCECLPWFLSFADKTECTVSKYSCLNNVNIDMTHCNCWLSCDHTSYSIKGVKKSLKDVTRIMLRNWPTALYRREMRFGYLDLLVSFGGIASLFLGFSLLSSIEFGYYFTLRTYCGAVVQSSRKQYNIVTVHVVEKLPNKVDTNLKYYQYID